MMKEQALEDSFRIFFFRIVSLTTFINSSALINSGPSSEVIIYFDKKPDSRNWSMGISNSEEVYLKTVSSSPRAL